MTKKLEPGDFVSVKSLEEIGELHRDPEYPGCLDGEIERSNVCVVTDVYESVEAAEKEGKLSGWDEWFLGEDCDEVHKTQYFIPICIILTSEGEVGWEWEKDLSRIDD